MKSNEQILAELQPIFDDVFGEDSVQLTMETISDDIIAWDSVAHVALIVHIEKQFDIMFDPDEIMEMENIGALVSSIQSKTNNA
jgi:acyl carrier protein